MDASAMFAPWSPFFTMAGSSAAALTGLMFVVITLVSGESRVPMTRDGVSTFSTPTVMHFCAALYVSAVFAAPWHSLATPAALIAACGLLGAAYVARISFKTGRLEVYQPDAEDWAWYAIVPFATYAAIVAGAAAMAAGKSAGPFVVGGCVVLMLFIGIRNSWDVVTYLAITKSKGSVDDDDEEVRRAASAAKADASAAAAPQAETPAPSAPAAAPQPATE